MTDPDTRIDNALSIALELGMIYGAHHKKWVIDQMVRALTDCPVIEYRGIDYRGEPYTYKGYGKSDMYKAFVAAAEYDEVADEEYDEWDTGIAP